MSIEKLLQLMCMFPLKLAFGPDDEGGDADDGDDGEDDGSDFEGTADDKDEDKDDDKSGDKDKDDADADKDKGDDKSDDKDAKDDEDDKSAALMVPKSRLDFKNRRIKALEEELETSRAITPVTDKQEEKTFETTLADLNIDLTKAHVDQDMEAAGAIQTKIQSLMVERIDAMAQSTQVNATADATEQIKLDSMIDALEAKHTILDETHEDFDQELSDEVLDMYDTLSQSGKYSNADALARSVELIVGVDVDGSPTGGRGTDIDKNIKNAGKTAPKNDGKDSDQGGVGTDLDGSKLSEAEFEALPEETKSRLRGDIL